MQHIHNEVLRDSERALKMAIATGDATEIASAAGLAKAAAQQAGNAEKYEKYHELEQEAFQLSVKQTQQQFGL